MDFVGAFLVSFWLPVGIFLAFLLAYAFSNLLDLKRTFSRVVGMLLGTSILLAVVTSLLPAFGSGRLDIQ